MQTAFNQNPAKALAGQPVGDRKSRPRQLPLLEQITLLTVTAGSETDDLVITVVDDETDQSYSATATGSATEATLLANALAAIRASEIDKIFSVAGEVDTDVLITFTARHSNRDYTISATGGTNATTAPAASNTQDAGGSGLTFGVLVAKGSEDGSFAAPTSTTTVADVLGGLFRTDGNHFHAAIENQDPADLDRCERGKEYAIMEQGRMWVEVEDAVTPSSTPYMRRAGTGTAGALRGSASSSGAQHTMTFTPSAVDLPGYGFEFDYLGQHYTALYLGDGTTTVAVACDGLVQDLGSITGLTITDGGTEVTIAAAAGTQLENVRNLASHTDVPVDSVDIATTVAADVEAIDVSSICEFETTASAGGLALLKIKAA